MSRTHSPPAVLLFLLWMLGLTSSKDAEVTCLFQEDCMLPCRFLRGGMVIHWYKQQIPVHSYYYQKDQLRLQNKHFSGRTHLFNAHISNGNASLILRKVKVQDQGRYKCFTSTRKDSQETFVNLHVKALIPLVRTEMTNESVTCLSQNIYPAPEVSWSTDPPVAPCALVNSTRKTPDSRGLFSIESRVGIVGNMSDYTYFCSVISADGSQKWTVSRRQQDDLFGESGRSLLIPCITPKPLQNFTLSWSFSRGRNPIILLTYDSRTRQTSSTWEGRVELDQEQVLLGNGSLRLPSPESGENTGSYTCTFSAFQTRHMLQTWVNVTDRSADEGQRVCKRSWWGTAASVCVFVLTMVAGVMRCFRMGGGPQGHVNGGKLVKIRMSQIDIPILELPRGDVTRSDGSDPIDGSGAILHEAAAGSHVTRDCDDFQRHPIPEGGITEIEALANDVVAEFLLGSDVTIPLPLETDLPTPAAPECVTGTPCSPGNEQFVQGAVKSDSTIPMQARGSESTPQVVGNDAMTPTTGSIEPNPGVPGHVMVIHCEPERPPKDQTQGLGSSNSDSYFLKLALFPSHKDLNSSIAPNMLDSDESVFIVPEQFQIHGFR